MNVFSDIPRAVRKSTPAPVNFRCHRRHPLKLNAIVECGSRPQRAVLKDLSCSGAALEVRGAELRSCGGRLRCWLDDGGGLLSVSMCEVSRRPLGWDRWEIGVRFDKLTRDDAWRIGRYLVRRRRRAAAMASERRASDAGVQLQ